MPIFTVKAGTDHNFVLPARHIIIDSITAGKSVILKGKSKNLELEYSVRGGGKLSGFLEVVSEWTIKNENAIDVDVVIQGGAIFYDENRIDGDVNTITSLANTTKNGDRYHGGGYLVAAAGVLAKIGIYNQAASGVNIWIDHMSISAAASDNFVTQNIADGQNGFIFQSNPKNKNAALLDSQSRVVIRNDIVVYGTQQIKIPLNLNGQALLNLERSPILVEPDKLLFFTPENVQIGVGVYFSTFEEPI